VTGFGKGFEMRVEVPILNVLFRQSPVPEFEGDPPPIGTKVINVSDRDREALLADPSFVYVGRRTRNGWPESPWGNPFKLSMFEGTDLKPRVEAVTCFAHMVIDPQTPLGADNLREKREFIRSNLQTLKGKTLGCWCCDLPTYPVYGWGDTELCHAVILARLVEGDLLLNWERPEQRGKRRKKKRKDPQQWFNFD
jgi:hypothetical protein